MNERDDGSGRTFKCSRVVIGETGLHEEGNIITPSKKCMVITENGQLWTITVYSFQAFEERIRQLWDTDPTKFIKLETTS